MPASSDSWHVKLRPGSSNDQQTDEAYRTRWASEKLPAPLQTKTARLPGISLLITKTVEGEPSQKYIDVLEPAQIISGLASAIKLLRSVDVTGFPFAPPAWATPQGVEKNLNRLKTSKLKHRELHPDFANRTYGELKAIVDTGPGTEKQVLTHGDLCMPNVLLDDDATLQGIIDLGGLHVGNDQLDVAIASWAVQANMGDEWSGQLLKMHGACESDQCILYNRLAYDLGLEHPDPWEWTQSPEMVTQRERLSA